MSRQEKRKGRGRRRGRTSSSGSMLGPVLIVAALAAIGALIFARVQIGARPAIDAATLCPVSGPTERVAIIVDMTDPVSAVTRSRIEAEVDAILDTLPAGASVSLGLVQPQDIGFETEIESLCHPGAPTDANPIYENPRLVAERFEQGFRTPLKNKLVALLDQPTADSSPILETIQAVASIALPSSNGAPKRLVVVSDLLQHSSILSHYRGDDWASFLASPAHRRVGRTLVDVDVTLLQLPRETARDTAYVSALEFWRFYFEAQGVSRISRRVIGDL